MSGSSQPASARSFAFAFTSARVSYDAAGRSYVTGPDRVRQDVTGIATLIFADGTIQERDGKPLVDDLFYYAANPDVWAAHAGSGFDADDHYASFGWREGRDPNQFFSTTGYLTAHPEVRASNANPLVHYDSSGWRSGFDPGPGFSSNGYLTANPDVRAAGIDPLSHFLEFGVVEGRRVVPSGSPPPVTPPPSPPPTNPPPTTNPPTNPSPGSIAPDGLDANYYLSTYTDVRDSGSDASLHYALWGWREGRNPNAYFDTRGYLATYGDVAAAGINPLTHYHQVGYAQGYDPGPAFDSRAYLVANPDVAAARIDPLFHYLRFGAAEGRAVIAKPLFDTDATAEAVVEGAATGTAIGATLSWGNWISPNLTYAITADSSGGGFAIDASTGRITVADGARLDYETSGPAQAYTVTVTARDGGFTISKTLTVAVGDVNDNAPVFTSGATGAEAENAPASNVVYKAAATDADGPPAFSTVRYGLTGTDAALFTIDAVSGEVRFKASPNFEAPADADRDNVYAVTVTASDGTFTNQKAVAISVTDVNEGPIFASGGSASTPENVATSTAVYTAQAASGDGSGSGASIRYSLAAGIGDNDRFAIDPVTGAVTFKASPDHEAPADGGADNVYDIAVTAIDNGNPALSATKAVAITVRDLNDSAPVFTSSATPSVPENTTAVVTLTTSDADTVGANPPTFSITGGADAALFTIVDGNRLAFANPRDFETQARSYAVQVTASDGANTTVQNLTVSLTDANDNGPVFTSPASATTPENVSALAIVYTALASDADGTAPNGTVGYSLAAGGDNGLFAIDAATGAVSFKASPNFEAPADAGGDNVYDITVVATDGGNPARASNQAVAITVTDVNDNAPVFTSGANARTPEGIATTTAVYTAQAADADGTAPNRTLRYGLAAGGDNDRFAIDAATGAVTFKASPNFEAPADVGGDNVYDITVTATDGGNPAISSSQAVAITVSNAPPSVPVDGNGAPNQTSNGAPQGSPTGLTAASTDPSGGAVTYSLIVDDGGRFRIDGATGVVTVGATAPVYDGGNPAGNVRTITVKAADAAGAFTTADFTITVNPNAPPANTVPATTRTTSEDTPLAIPGVSVADSDSTNLTTTLSVVHGTVSVAGGGATITGNGSGTVTIAGTAAQINTALSSLFYTSTADYNGSDTLTVSTTDGSSTTTSTVGVSVAPLVDIANDGATTDEDRAVNIEVNVNDTFENPGHAITAINGSAITAGGPAVAVTNGAVALKLDGTLDFTPSRDFNGPTSFTYTVTSGGVTETATVNVTVNAVNDAPVNSVPGPQTINEDGVLVYSAANGNALSISDVDANGGVLTTQLTVLRGTLDVTGTGGNASVIQNGTGDVFITGTVADINAALATVTYRPNSNVNGVDGISVATRDNGNSGSGGQKFDSGDLATIVIDAVNDAPSGADETITGAGAHVFTAADFGFTDPSDANAFSGANSLKAVEITTLPGSGTLTNGGAPVAAGTFVPVADITGGKLVFTPDMARNTTTFTFRVQDDGGTDRGGVDLDPVPNTITLVPNTAPLNAVPGAQTTDEDTLVPVSGVTVSDADGGPLTTTLSVVHGRVSVTEGGGATVTGNGSGTVTISGSATQVNAALSGLIYTNIEDYNGSDTLTVSTTDGYSSAAVSTVGITVRPVRDITDDTATTNEETPVNINVRLNDSFENAGQTITAINGSAINAGGAAVAVANGTVALTLDGKLDFTPSQDFAGPTSFTYTVSSGGVTETANVAVSVNGINDAPVNNLPAAQSVNEDTRLVFSGANGNAITVSDVDGGQIVTTVTILHGSFNNPPFNNGLDGTFLSFDGRTLQLTGSSSGINQALNGLTYTPAGNYNGPETLTISTNDQGSSGSGGAKTTTSTLSITVNSVNDAPAGTDKTITGAGPHAFTAADFGFGDPNDDPAGSLLAVKIASLPATGSLTNNGAPVAAGTFIPVADIDAGKLVFTPGMTGNTTTFTFQVQDNGGTANGGVDLDQSANTITLASSQPPVANNDAVSATEAGGTANGTPGSNPSGNVVTGTGGHGEVADTDDVTPTNLLTVVAVHTGAEGSSGQTAGTVGTGLASANGYGTLTLNGDGSYTYTVNQSSGAVQALNVGGTLKDYFNYTVQDANGGRDTATVTVTIDGANDAAVFDPVFSDFDGTVIEAGGLNNANRGAPRASGVLLSEDVDSPRNVYTAVSTPAASDGGYGTYTMTSGGRWTYTLDNANPTVQALAAFQGKTDTFTVTTVDGTRQTITIQIEGANDAPTASSFTTTGPQDTGRTITLSATDPDNGDRFFEYQILTLPPASEGTLYDDSNPDFRLRISANQQLDANTVYFEPAPGFTGTGSFQYRVNDTQQAYSPAATVTIDVTSSNQPPVITAGRTLAYTENATSAIDPALAVSDANDANLTGARVQITGGYVSGEDVLALPAQSNVTGSFNAATGTLTLTGTASVADYQAALRAITYRNTSDNPSTADRIVTFTANDGKVDSTPATGTIQVTAVNDAPVNSVPQPNGPLVRISTSSAGVQSNGTSLYPVFSPDGEKVVFQSAASNLVGSDGNGASDVFLKTIATGEVTRISVNALGQEANGGSGQPVFSPDGTKVAFQSDARNLVANDGNGSTDVFVKDLTTGAVTLVSSGFGGQGDAGSFQPAFSADGRKIVFASAADNLVPGDNNGKTDIFVKDLDTQAVTLVSTNNSGAQGNDNSSEPVFSPDGNKVAFASYARNFATTGDSGGFQCIYVKDLTTGALTLVSSSASNQVGITSFPPLGFSPDSKSVIFSSAADNLVPNDTNFAEDVFVKNIETGAITRVSTTSTGAQTSGTFIPYSLSSAFSPDGSKVVFLSAAANLPGASGNTLQVYVKDLATQAVTNVGSLGTPVAAYGVDPTFSPDGSKVLVFKSYASTGGQYNRSDSYDIYVKTLYQSTFENKPLVFDTAHGNAITISDPDANGGDETVTLSVAHGKLTLHSTAGLSFTAGDGSGDATMTFTGTVAEVNAALNGLTYLGNTNYTGQDTLTIRTSDQGHSGAGGALTDTDTVAITVAPGDPVFAAHDAGTFDLHLSTIADAATAHVETLPTSGTIAHADGTALDAGATLSASQLAGLTFTPIGDGADHASSFVFSVADGDHVALHRLPISVRSGSDLTLTGTPAKDIIVGGGGNDTLDGAGGGNFLTGNGGADTFVFDTEALADASGIAKLVDHVTDYSAAQGDAIDLSALFSAIPDPLAHAASLVHATADAGGGFASLSVDTAAPGAAPHWVEIAHLAGLRPGQTIDLALDAAQPKQLAHILVDGWLVA